MISKNDKLPKPLKPEELYNYIKKAQNGDKKFRNKIIEHNLKLIIDIISKHFKNTNYELDDLFSIGVEGLVKAIETFDMEKKNRFSTYAFICIKNEILMFIRLNKKYLIEDSLEQPINVGEGRELTLANIIEDPNSNFIIKIEKSELLRELRKNVELLDEERRVITKMYYGFYGDVMSIPEIAKIRKKNIRRITRKLKEALEIIKIQLLEKGLIEYRQKENDYLTSRTKRKSIYNYFAEYNYSESQVDMMLSMLNADDKQLIYLLNGKDLHEPQINAQADEECVKKYYEELIPKMQNLLEAIDAEQNTMKTKTQLGKEEEKMGKKQSFYQWLEKLGVSREKADEILKKITPETMKLITARFGEDLDVPPANVSREARNSFAKKGIPEIEKILGIKIGKNKNNETDKVSQQSSKPDKTPQQSNQTNKVTQHETSDISTLKEIQSLINSPEFKEYIMTCPTQDQVIISLSLGLINGKSFETHVIAEMFGMEYNAVYEIIRKGLEAYKEILIANYRTKLDNIFSGAMVTLGGETKPQK